MRDNPEGSKLNPADDVRIRCKNSPSVLSCRGKRTREGCNRGSAVGIVHAKKILLRRQFCVQIFVNKVICTDMLHLKYRKYGLSFSDSGADSKKWPIFTDTASLVPY